MSDELTEVKYFKEMKGLKSLQVKAQAYLEPKRASMISFFVKTVNNLLFSQKINSIIDTKLGSKEASENNEICKTKLRSSTSS